MENNLIEVIEAENVSYSNDDLFNISSWGADMSFRELITMYEEGDLIKPELQRKYVWSKDEASRFIDSILLGLPVPSIFLAVDTQERRLIVDGYQRIMSVYDFVRGKFSDEDKVFKLSNKEIINKHWRNKSFIELSEEEKRRIKTTTIHSIIFEQKNQKSDTGMYQIFERINTSGKSLKPQEIRNCVYQGSFNSLLFELNEDEKWRHILKSKKPDTRMYDIELILRFFAMKDFDINSETYEKQINLTNYLNIFMGENRDASDELINQYRIQFKKMISIVVDCFDDIIFRRPSKKSGYTKQIHPITFEAISIATYRKAKSNFNFNIINDYKNRYKELMSNPSFIESTTNRTTNYENIKARITLASNILFGDIDDNKW